MGRLFFGSEEKGEEVPNGGSIIEACKKNGVNFSCKDGLCGSCVIEVTEGQENLSSHTVEEEDFFENVTPKVRLACQCTIKHGEAHITPNPAV